MAVFLLTLTGFLIEDNYDSELTVSRKSEKSLFSMTKASNVIYINTFSKTIAPSVRTGYMILPEKMEKPFNEELEFYDYPDETLTLNSPPYGLPFYKAIGFVPTDEEKTVNGIRFTPMKYEGK